jgi:pilus assembly protein TadC
MKQNLKSFKTYLPTSTYLSTLAYLPTYLFILGIFTYPPIFILNVSKI